MIPIPPDWVVSLSVWLTVGVESLAVLGLGFACYQLVIPRRLRGQVPYFLLALRRNPNTRVLFGALELLPAYREDDPEFRHALERTLYKLNGLGKRLGIVERKYGGIAKADQYKLFALAPFPEGFAKVEKALGPLGNSLSELQDGKVSRVVNYYRKYFEFGYVSGGLIYSFQLSVLVALGYTPNKVEIEYAYMALYRLRLETKVYQAQPLEVYQAYEIGLLLSLLKTNLSEREYFVSLLELFLKEHRYVSNPPNPSRRLFKLYFGEHYEPTSSFI